MWPFTSTSTNAQPAPASTSGCPVDHDTRQQWLKDQPPAAESASTMPRPDLPHHRLSEDREVSSIPRWLPASSSRQDESSYAAAAATPPSACPAHDPNFKPTQTQPTEEPALNSAERAAIVPSESNWVYPSPSSFYRALSAKNRNPNPQDMDIVVPIHNAVNERVWQQVLEWERAALGLEPGQDTGVKLVSFMGRPKQMSPRARWKSLIGYTAPFDRHDWIVDRPLPAKSSSAAPDAPESIRVRYVIDFYTGRGANLLAQIPPSDSPSSTTSSTTGPTTPTTREPAKEDLKMPPNLAFFIDCRPALDDWEGVRMRFNKYWGL
ncbi:cytochrome c1 heme lyase CYT2 [Sporobolomyces koalae]|uniref:cytochrome c1 heme lyase CYT2 n=1 Tax=Sporobolomyces koalae TaxID=500713 RepID=UPI00317BDA90